jgi:predicted nucleic acid binding AN1-type Zn finger protein
MLNKLQKYDLQMLVDFIPISAYHGDNLFDNSENMPWFEGVCLTKTLDKLASKSFTQNQKLNQAKTSIKCPIGHDCVQFNQYHPTYTPKGLYAKCESFPTGCGTDITLGYHCNICEFDLCLDCANKPFQAPVTVNKFRAAIIEWKEES